MLFNLSTCAHHLLSLAIALNYPMDSVSIHLGENKWSVVLYGEISFLDGRHWTRTAAKLA